MKINLNTKILIGFLTLMFLGFGWLAVIYINQKNIINTFQQIKEVEGFLGVMPEKIIGYDSIMTEEVRTILLHLQKGEKYDIEEHKIKYTEFSGKMRDLLKNQIPILLEQSQRFLENKDKVKIIVSKIDELNDKLSFRNEGALGAMEKGDLDTAYFLIMDSYQEAEYPQYKKELYENYKIWSNLESESSLIIQNQVINKSKTMLYFSFVISILLFIIYGVGVLFLISFIKKIIAEKELVKSD